MNKRIIEHLFEFWARIGWHGEFLHQGVGYQYTKAPKDSWPSKVFGLMPDKFTAKDLFDGIGDGKLPNAIGMREQNETGNLLSENGFKLKSKVKAMSLNISSLPHFTGDVEGIITVDSDETAKLFAQVASEAFGYTILESTISPLLEDSGFQLFLGKHEKMYATCGMVYLDKDGVSGIHMIGTLPAYRGMGLGKQMTQFLINEALKNESDQVYLVASQAGERIYGKMGFKTYGNLKSYVL